MKWFLRWSGKISGTFFKAKDKAPRNPMDNGWTDEARKKLEENARFLEAKKDDTGGRNHGNNQ